MAYLAAFWLVSDLCRHSKPAAAAGTATLPPTSWRLGWEVLVVWLESAESVYNDILEKLDLLNQIKPIKPNSSYYISLLVPMSVRIRII